MELIGKHGRGGGQFFVSLFKRGAKKETPPQKKRKKEKNKLGLSCAKLSLASAKLHTSLSLSSDQLKLATN